MEAKVKTFARRDSFGGTYKGLAAFLTALGPTGVIGLVSRVGTRDGMTETWSVDVWYWGDSGEAVTE